MRFNYIPVEVDVYGDGSERRVVYRPIIKVEIKYNSISIPTEALIDFGADCCVFNISFGEALKIDFTKIKPEIIRGINSIPTDIYYEDVKLLIRSNSIKIRCGFLKDLKINLLGQDGIFNKYKVNFFYNDRYFEMIPSSKI